MADVNINEEEIQQSSSSFTCSNCGGDVVFDPASQKIVCPYCGHTETIETDGDILEKDFAKALREEPVEDWGMKTRVIKCDDCGGETIMEDSVVAKHCVFCGSPHVVDLSEFKGIKPESVLPFKIDKEGAEELFKKWLKKRLFAPKRLKKEYRTDRINGMYLPYWTYDSDTYSTYTAQAGTYYYVTEHYTTVENGKTVRKTRQVRKISWRFVSGDYALFVNDVLINASKGNDKKIIKKIEPFDLSLLVPYKAQFLAGFFAKRYSINLKEGWAQAKSIINTLLRRNIIRQIAADEVRNLRIRTNHNNVTYKHLLLPIWISSYRFRKKSYNFMINGQSGEVRGKFPVSFWKVLFTILIIIGVIAAFLYIYGS